MIKETHKHGLDLRTRHACFFRLRWILYFPLHALSFCFRIYWKHHVLSPLMTLSNISALRKRSDEMWSQRRFWSCVKIRGTIFAEIFLFPKSSFTICCIVSLFIFSSSAIILTPNLRYEHTNVHTLSTFVSALCVFGCPLLGSSYTSSHPSLNRLCHSKALDFFIVYSP